MEGHRGRSRYRSPSWGRARAMSISRSRSRGGAFAGAYAAGRASYALRVRGRGVVARRARAMLNRRTAGFLGIERKFYDTMLAATTIAAATDATGGEYDPSATSMISTPVQGDGEQNRDGKRILIDAVEIKGLVSWPAIANDTAMPAGREVFIALVLDTQTNGAQMNSEDCFKNLSANALGNTSPLRNLLFSSRFRVLKEWSVLLEPKTAVNNASATTVSVAGTRGEFDCFIPLDLNVNFNSGTSASIANVIDNSLHIVAFCSSTTLAPTIGYNARIRFMG